MPMIAPIDPRRRKGLNGRHVLASLVTFFLVVFMVNGAMIYSALSTYSGAVVSEPFRKGLHYNDRILADTRQHNLHWQETIAIDREGRVVFSLVSADGSPVRGLSVEALVGRPSTNRHDVTLILTPEPAGSYAGQPLPLAPGSWLVAIEARFPEANEPAFRARRRLWITP